MQGTGNSLRNSHCCYQWNKTVIKVLNFDTFYFNYVHFFSYYFGCCQLREPIVNEESCHYTRVTGTGTADWFYDVPEDQVVRGISAQWTPVQKYVEHGQTVW